MLDLLDNTKNINGTGKPHKANSQEVEIQRTRVWLAGRIETAKKEPTTEWVTLTPVLAALLLDLNPDNRNQSEGIKEVYSRDMSAERWQANGESLIVSRDGYLNDGQHRCLGVISSKTTIRTVIVFGVERESRLTVDQGKVRTAGDYLGMNGFKYSNQIAAICGYIWQYREKGRISGSQRDRPTKSEIMLLADHYKDICESVVFIGRPGVSIVGGVSLLAFCHWEISRKASQTRVNEFFDHLITGEEISGVMLRLRNRLVSKERLVPNEKIELIFRAWNALARKENPRNLVALNGQIPKIVRG